MTLELDSLVERFAPTIGTLRACRAFGVTPRTYRHRRQAREERLPVRRAAPPQPREPHPAALSLEEKERVLSALCSERFCDVSPAQVFMTLLDDGTYLCSVRHMYRLLEEHGLSRERRRGGHQHSGRYPAPRLEAMAPNQCWSWDITKLRGPAKGVLYYLYTILDIYSRCVVGWTLATRESESVAHALIRRACQREGVDPTQLTLHADRGGPMIAGSVAELLMELGVHESHSRPRVSNDNPFIEAHFKTLKYQPDYPDRFQGLKAARDWCRAFFEWYNHTHYHSAIAYLHPADLHAGREGGILERLAFDTVWAQWGEPPGVVA